MSKKTKYSIILAIITVFWGLAFAFQSMGADNVGPMTFMAVRNVIAVIVMSVIMLFRKDDDLTDNKYSIKIGIACGVVHCSASMFQQMGIAYTTAANASFITAMYVILVPALAMLWGKKTDKRIWLCVVLELFGMYLLCIKDSFTINKGDVLMILTAILFAVHIICLDLGGQKMDPAIVCFTQFFVSAIISTILMLSFEMPINFEGIKASIIPLVYTGAISSAICITIQATAQKELDPTIASVIMCLESIFGAVGGWLLLHEVLNLKEILGCVIMFVALILSQIFNKNN